MAAPLIAASAAKGLAENKYSPFIVGGLIVGIGAIAYFGIYRGLVRPRLCSSGILECETKGMKLDRKIAEFDGFNPTYYEPFNLTISYEKAKALRNQIRDAIKGAGTNEESLFSAIQSVGSKHNLSLVSKEYQAQYGTSLADSINDDTSYTEKKRILDILKKIR